jgi:hypothetical protein
MPRTKSLNERLLSAHYETFIDALQECMRQGDAGDAALADALPVVTKDRRVMIAAALGDMRGDAGSEALRKAIDAPGALRDLQIVDRPRINANDPSEVAIAIGYLARHVLATGSSRSTTLITWIREHWDVLTGDERRWLGKHWPGCAPTGGDPASVPPADAEAIRQSVRGPLFDAPAFDFDDS